MKGIISIFFALLMSACVSHGSVISDQDLANLKIGITTKSEMMVKFGKPVVKTMSSDGSEILAWSYVKAGPFVAAEVKSVSLTFDQSGKLTHYSVVDSSS